MYKLLGRLENQEHFKAIEGFKLKSLCNVSRGRRGCYRVFSIRVFSIRVFSIRVFSIQYSVFEYSVFEYSVFSLSFLDALISCVNFAVRAANTKIISLQLFASKLSCYTLLLLRAWAYYFFSPVNPNQRYCMRTPETKTKAN